MAETVLSNGAFRHDSVEDRVDSLDIGKPGIVHWVSLISNASRAASKLSSVSKPNTFEFVVSYRVEDGGILVVQRLSPAPYLFVARYNEKFRLQKEVTIDNVVIQGAYEIFSFRLSGNEAKNPKLSQLLIPFSNVSSSRVTAMQLSSVNFLNLKQLECERVAEFVVGGKNRKPTGNTVRKTLMAYNRLFVFLPISISNVLIGTGDLLPDQCDLLARHVSKLISVFDESNVREEMHIIRLSLELLRIEDYARSFVKCAGHKVLMKIFCRSKLKNPFLCLTCADCITLSLHNGVRGGNLFESDEFSETYARALSIMVQPEVCLRLRFACAELAFHSRVVHEVWSLAKGLRELVASSGMSSKVRLSVTDSDWGSWKRLFHTCHQSFQRSVHKSRLNGDYTGIGVHVPAAVTLCAALSAQDIVPLSLAVLNGLELQTELVNEFMSQFFGFVALLATDPCGLEFLLSESQSLVAEICRVVSTCVSRVEDVTCFSARFWSSGLISGDSMYGRNVLCLLSVASKRAFISIVKSLEHESHFWMDSVEESLCCLESISSSRLGQSIVADLFRSRIPKVRARCQHLLKRFVKDPVKSVACRMLKLESLCLNESGIVGDMDLLQRVSALEPESLDSAIKRLENVEQGFSDAGQLMEDMKFVAREMGSILSLLSVSETSLDASHAAKHLQVQARSIDASQRVLRSISSIFSSWSWSSYKTDQGPRSDVDVRRITALGAESMYYAVACIRAVYQSLKVAHWVRPLCECILVAAIQCLTIRATSKGGTGLSPRAAVFDDFLATAVFFLAEINSLHSACGICYDIILEIYSRDPFLRAECFFLMLWILPHTRSECFAGTEEHAGADRQYCLQCEEKVMDRLVMFCSSLFFSQESVVASSYGLFFSRLLDFLSTDCAGCVVRALLHVISPFAKETGATSLKLVDYLLTLCRSSTFVYFSVNFGLVPVLANLMETGLETNISSVSRAVEVSQLILFTSVLNPSVIPSDFCRGPEVLSPLIRVLFALLVDCDMDLCVKVLDIFDSLSTSKFGSYLLLACEEGFSKDRNHERVSALYSLLYRLVPVMRRAANVSRRAADISAKAVSMADNVCRHFPHRQALFAMLDWQCGGVGYTLGEPGASPVEPQWRSGRHPLLLLHDAARTHVLSGEPADCFGLVVQGISDFVSKIKDLDRKDPEPLPWITMSDAREIHAVLSKERGMYVPGRRLETVIHGPKQVPVNIRRFSDHLSSTSLGASAFESRGSSRISRLIEMHENVDRDGRTSSSHISEGNPHRKDHIMHKLPLPEGGDTEQRAYLSNKRRRAEEHLPIRDMIKEAESNSYDFWNRRDWSSVAASLPHFKKARGRHMEEFPREVAALVDRIVNDPDRATQFLSEHVDVLREVIAGTRRI